jgi:hypothetical protein
MTETIRKRATCRVSGEPLIPLFSLGELYVSDFIEQDKKPRTPKAELELALAPKSGLVQLTQTVPSDLMYRHYWYLSGTNESMRRELENIAQTATRLIHPETSDVWIDIGCNDGTLFSFLDTSLTRIGYDPAKNKHVEKARGYSSLFVNDYFSANAYLSSPYGNKKARVITSIAMFYDLEDPNAFVADIKKVLDKNGLWIIQMSYLPLMLEQLAFDNICHEHLEYYSLTSLKYLLDAHDLEIVDCELNDVNGGSFRIYIRHEDADLSTFATAPYRDVAAYRIQSIFAYEKTLKLTDPKTYEKFYSRMCNLKEQTLFFIETEKKKGKKIWGYGASTKGNTLLQWFGLNEAHLEGIAERQSEKFRLKTVGSNIPIFSEEEMRKANPDYLLVLPWHFIENFVRREKEFLDRGGKFILPCPHFEIIGK